MEKIIWILEKERLNMFDIQRKINSFGGMRATCMLSTLALKKSIDELVDKEDSVLGSPSVILIDYNMIADNDTALKMLKSRPNLASIPLIFMVENDNDDIKEECFHKGAVLVLKKPLSKAEAIRIEHLAWQYEVSINYERIFLKQETELQIAKEIKELNKRLESRNEFLHRIFGKYFSDEVLEVILERPDGEFIGGDRRNLAILLSDLRGFSAMAEEMSAEALTDLLNYYFGTMIEVISKYNGTVIEYTGDGVLAVFGAPIKTENYCENAIAAAVTMQNKMYEVNDYCKKMGYETLQMGIGVHWGEAFVGNIGSEKMMRYNVIGSVVNACSRIEGCSVGGQVLASEDILDRVKCDVQIIRKSKISAKGISKKINLCEIIGIGGDYGCYIHETVDEEKYYVLKNEVLELYTIHNKVIEEIPREVSLIEISLNRIKVDMCQYFEGHEEMKLYSDVEVRCKNEKLGIGFSGVYAKVVNVSGKHVTLHFTHINEDLKKAYKKVIEDGQMCKNVRTSE